MIRSIRRLIPLASLTSLTLLVLMIAPITAHSTTAMQGSKTKLTFWNYWDGGNGEEIQRLVDRYNKEHPTVEVENVFIGFNDLLPKLQAATAGGDGPDIAAGDLIWMPKLAESGALVPLDDYVKQAGIDLADFYPALLNVNKYQDKLYGLPVSTNNLQLFYNKELFTQAGLDPSKPPTTWDELRQMAKQCMNDDQGISGMELFTEPGEGLTWQYQVYLWQAGGDFLSSDLSKAAFNSPAGLKALQYWVDLLQTDKSAPIAPWGAFGQGKSCMAMDGSWMVGIWSKEPPFELGTAPMPIPAGGSAATNMGGEQLFLFQTSDEKQQAAFDFANWLTSAQIQQEWDQATGFTPVREAVATSTDYLQWVKTEQPLLAPFVENQKNARNRPPIKNYPEVSDAFSRQIEAALLGEATPADALAAAEKDVNALLGS